MQIDCLSFVEEKKQSLKKEVAVLKGHNISPKLVVINVGNDQASLSYIKNKIKIGTELGVLVEFLHYQDIAETDLLSLIDRLNNDDDVHAIICQLPLPSKLNKDKIINTISPEKDVDCLTKINYGLFLTSRENTGLIPCTAKGVWSLLKWLPINLEGKHAVIVNRSDIVGKPTANLLLNENCTITICHSKTKNVKQYLQVADIIVLGVGQRNFLLKEDVKENAVVIDISINRGENNRLCGDADFQNLVDKCWISPVPKGVGPITVVMIFDNLISLIKKKRN